MFFKLMEKFKDVPPFIVETFIIKVVNAQCALHTWEQLKKPFDANNEKN